MFDWLRREGYIHVDFFGMDPMGALAQAALSGLSTKGLIEIGKFPDPDERLAHAFERARNTLTQDSSIPPDERCGRDIAWQCWPGPDDREQFATIGE